MWLLFESGNYCHIFLTADAYYIEEQIQLVDELLLESGVKWKVVSMRASTVVTLQMLDFLSKNWLCMNSFHILYILYEYFGGSCTLQKKGWLCFILKTLLAVMLLDMFWYGGMMAGIMGCLLIIRTNQVIISKCE